MTTFTRGQINKEKGFSMIELLLAVVTLGLILGVLYQFLLLANQQSRSTTSKQISTDQIGLLLKSISQEIRNALSINISSEGGDTAYFETQIDEENPQPLLIATLLIPNPDEESENLEIKYEIVLNRALWENKGEKEYMLQKRIYQGSSLVKSLVLVRNVYSFRLQQTASQRIDIKIEVPLKKEIKSFCTSIIIRNPLSA